MSAVAPETDLLVGLVGVCKSGKSLLKANLERHGYRVKHIAQEHSFAPQMWRQIANPDILIFMEVSYQDTVERGQRWNEAEYNEQLHRLAHARAHADWVVNTSLATPEDVLNQVLDFLRGPAAAGQV